MKKQVTKIATLALAIVSFAAFSQERVYPCATDEVMQKMLLNPVMKKNYDAAQEQLKQSLQSGGAKSAAFVYTVPVVFHVLYQCNGSTISDATLMQVLKEINDDYSRNSADTNLIATAFKNSYVDAEIKFMLAKKDPFGNCISGIVRHNDAKTNWDKEAATSGPPGPAVYYTYTWDPTRYLNIYLVSQIISAPGSIGITVGYTFKPGPFSSGQSHDAIVYNMNYLTGATNGAPKTRSLSHEIGHWLNLDHTWGGTNSPGVNCLADDGITDTPVTKGEFGGCASSTISTCTQTNPAMAGLNNVQNIMNYSDCPRNFTSGQITTMRNTLANAINGRNNLYNPGNLVFTGVNNTGICTPVAEFFATNCSFTVCQGSSLTMKDYSYNGTITATQWDADNGAIVASPNASITSISFPTAGTSVVTLTVTNAQGIATKSRTVTVIDATAGITGPNMESFETPGIPTGWSVADGANDNHTWEQTGAAAYDQSNSFVIDGSLLPANAVESLETPIMDVLHNQTNVFEFAYAYRQETSAFNDALKIEGSKDCGGTWQTIYSLSAANMAAGSGGVSTDDFVPFSNEWKIYTISSHPNWQNYKTSASVKVRFTFVAPNGHGNNVYVDAINFYSLTGVNELTKSILFNVYPNPTTSETSVNFKLDDAASVKITVLDIMGREVLPAIENNYPAGEQTISINKDNTLSKGVYFVNLSLNGAKMSSKLVIH